MTSLDKQKWEYMYFIANAVLASEYKQFERFDEWGKQGWELVTIYNGNLFIFKRPV